MKTKWYEVELNEEYASYIGYDFCDKCYGQFDTLTEARKFMKKVFKNLKKEIKGFERYKRDEKITKIVIVKSVKNLFIISSPFINYEF